MVDPWDPNRLAFATASELATAICSREVSAVEVLEVHLARIARHNPALRAIVTLDEPGARQRAGAADAALAAGEIWGPLHGVPVTVKDSFETAGLRTTGSCPRLSSYVPQQDAAVVARLRHAGAIILGKTNLPELARDAQCNSPVFGRTNNPWDLGRTSGGSSGGGAAAVAAGLSPLDFGSDMAGSLRLPAHYCGIFALKPTEGRVSGAGHIPDLPGEPRAMTRYMNTFGPLARSVEDLALALSVLAGDGSEPDAPPVPLFAPLAVDTTGGLAKLRLAWSDGFDGVPVAREVRDLLGGAVDALHAAGCVVERHNPLGFDFDAAWQNYGEILGAQATVSLPSALRFAGSLNNALRYPGEPMQAGMSRGMRGGLRGYLAALTRKDRFVTAMDRFLAGWDAWLCPVSSTPAFTHRPSASTAPGRPLEVDQRRVAYWPATIYHTALFNLTGNPVVVIPVGLTASGLPVGMQVVGPRWTDMALLAIAAQIAAVIHQPGRPPGY